ncbi:MAG: type II secretion system protein GspE, partial [Deltaproteobacteria bacterium CG_4_10_14_0_2_um_filter_43_8]
MQSLRELLTQIVEMKASDLHINVGVPPTMRFDGELKAVNDHVLSHDEAKLLCFEFLEPDQIKRFEEKLSVDFSFGIDGVSRFRGNLYISVGNICGAFRPIPHKIPDAAEIGLPNVVVNLSKRPRGLVLVTGPTGSGKSTTLSALLNLVNKTRHDHIVTIEDPIEYKLEGINQVQVREKQGLTFSSVLRSVLRQDPDVIMLGEVRDEETAATAFQAALTGHLVLTTLHTNDTIAAVTRLADMGVERFKVASGLVAITAQRLIRRLCGECRRPVEAAAIEQTLRAAFMAEGLEPKAWAAAGCAKCDMTGYKGRLLLVEFLEVAPALRERIVAGDGEADLRRAALSSGSLHSLRNDALRRVQE